MKKLMMTAMMLTVVGCSTGPLPKFPTQAQVNQFYANGGPEARAEAFVSTHNANQQVAPIVEAINAQTEALKDDSDPYKYGTTAWKLRQLRNDVSDLQSKID